jgi:hypothetical protein
MTENTARLRKLEAKARDTSRSPEERGITLAVLERETRNALPDLLTAAEERDTLKAENERMRTVVEAARAWDKRRGQFLQDKLAIELNEALSAMEQNDTAPSALQEGE